MSSQGGKVSITLNAEANFPRNASSKEDQAAADRVFQFQLGLFAHPIYSKTGDYPPIVRQIVDQNSAKEGRPRSRLPRFTAEEVEQLKGSFDFFGLNHYTSILVTNKNQSSEHVLPSFTNDQAVNTSADPKWPSGKSSWLKVVPEGFRVLLNWIKKEYDNPPVYVTENGYSDDGQLEDDIRVDSYKGYLNALLEAITIDECNVIGYTAWSLLDNFEWIDGYTSHFGLVQVDFSSPERTRTPKKSAKFWKSFLAD
uniref:Myrosinase 1 n=1 Tax=Cacopsylla melanoneura TaxID=428564 RepID=A0A8D9AQ66_9HEMI